MLEAIVLAVAVAASAPDCAKPKVSPRPKTSQPPVIKPGSAWPKKKRKKEPEPCPVVKPPLYVLPPPVVLEQPAPVIPEPEPMPALLPPEPLPPLEEETEPFSAPPVAFVPVYLPGGYVAFTRLPDIAPPVPEPETWAMLAAGLALIARKRFRGFIGWKR